MASDLKSDLAMMAFQRRPHVKLMGNPAVLGTNWLYARKRREFAYISLLSENHRFFAKITDFWPYGDQSVLDIQNDISSCFFPLTS